MIDEALVYRDATVDDVDALVDIEKKCFDMDRLSRRSFRRHIVSVHSDLLIVEDQKSEKKIVGYGLVLSLRGTRLARLYSLAVLPSYRGKGLARSLLEKLENAARERNRLYMRLEVGSKNYQAIHLYESMGYRVFGEYTNYYEDHSAALRMQKKIRDIQAAAIKRPTPWYQQTTEFTCGPAALMMAMESLSPQIECRQEVEIAIWREATTVFMTSGHGGCHPLGLALAACRRGFQVEAWLSLSTPLFLDGVRSEKKKQVMRMVHNQYVEACEREGVRVKYQEVSQAQVEYWLNHGYAVIILISTYRLDGKKAPHWVVATGIDDYCIYVHDPDPDDKYQLPLDFQYVPIAREDFEKMSAFGGQRLRAAVALIK